MDTGRECTACHHPRYRQHLMSDGYWTCDGCGHHDPAPTAWFARDSRGRIVVADSTGYSAEHYPGPGEQYADCDGVWFEYMTEVA